MNRFALILELLGAGVTPPPTITNDALFDCVDFVRRKKAGESPVLHTVEMDVWGQPAAIARAVFCLA